VDRRHSEQRRPASLGQKRSQCAAARRRYRSLWYVTGNAHGAYFAFGIHGQWIYVDPPSGMVIAKQSSWPDPLDDAMERLHLAGFDAIARALAE
jgi:CubicO group peptidase (beta-lactamase class C family)